jgi:FMN-dependent NADH-azoreductase
VANEFVGAYVKKNPAVHVVTINVFHDDIPAFDGEAVQAKYAVMHGAEHTEAQQEVWARIQKTIEQFTSVDKYVFAVPMWNFSIPYRLKQYIDVIVQPGLTFTVNENGYEGLVKDKPAFIVYARGGRYAPGSGAEAYDLQSKYFEQILQFIGFQDIKTMFVEPTLAEGRPLNVLVSWSMIFNNRLPDIIPIIHIIRAKVTLALQE